MKLSVLRIAFKFPFYLIIIIIDFFYFKEYLPT